MLVICGLLFYFGLQRIACGWFGILYFWWLGVYVCLLVGWLFRCSCICLRLVLGYVCGFGGFGYC